MVALLSRGFLALVPLPPSSFLLLVAMPLLLVGRPGAPSSCTCETGAGLAIVIQ